MAEMSSEDAVSQGRMVRTSAASIQPRRFRLLLETHTASALSIMPGNKVNPRPGQNG